MSKNKKILILNHYNLNNGDRAMLEATLELLKKNNLFDVSITVFDPDKFKLSASSMSSKVHGWGVKLRLKPYRVIFRLYKRFIITNFFARIMTLFLDKKIKTEIINSDIILVSGGHHLTDIVGDHNFNTMSIPILFCIYKKKEVFMLPQTIGPFKKMEKYKYVFLNTMLSNAKCVAVRDKNSIAFLEENKIQCKQLVVIPDLVYGLKSSYNRKNVYLSDNKKNIGIALYGNYTGPHASKKLEEIIKDLTAFISQAKEKYYFNFIPMETVDSMKDDRLLIEKIIIDSNLTKEEYQILDNDGNIKDIIGFFAVNDMNIAYKTHSVLFSLITSVPVLSVAYHQKSKDFMSEYGLDSYSIWDYEATPVNIFNQCVKILENREIIIDVMKEKSAKFDELLNKYFSNIFIN